MRVVHVGEYVSGGVATYLRTLIKFQITDEKIDDIYILKSKHGSEKLKFQSNKVHVINYEYDRSMSGVLKLLRLWVQIKQLHPDVVHMHSTFAGLLRVRNLFIKAKFKVVYCSHGWAFTQDSGWLKNSAYAFVERIMAYGCNEIINVSEDERIVAERRGLPAKKMITIGNAVEVPEFLPKKKPNEGRLQMLYIGRFDRQKGVDILIEAAKSLPNIDFRLAGKSVVDSMDIEHKELPNNVKLLGWLDTHAVSERVLKCDAVIIPSRWEAFGLSAVEAMMNATAVLASNVGGLPYIVQEGITGLLFEPNSPNEIVRVLNSVSREQLLEFGQKGQMYAVKHFNAQSMEEQIRQVYGI